MENDRSLLLVEKSTFERLSKKKKNSIERFQWKKLPEKKNQVMHL